MSSAPIQIQVNLNIEVDANSAFTIFGQTYADASGNIIVADIKLPVKTLYDASAGPDGNDLGFIELWEPSSEPDDIYCSLAHQNIDASSNFTDAYNTMAQRLVKGFQRILCGQFDCSNAIPFNRSIYGQQEVYTKQPHFGRLALANVANSIFNHIDATGAISNDKSFMKNILSINDDASGNAAILADATQYNLRFKSYRRFADGDTDLSGNVLGWKPTDASDASDANIALFLTKALMRKGFNGVYYDASASGYTTLTKGDMSTIGFNVTSITDVSGNLEAEKSTLAHIVAQVIKQDISRLTNTDNNERTKNIHQVLRFYKDDVIYVKIIMNTPEVTVGTGGASAVSGILSSWNKVEDRTKEFTIKITLSDEDLSVLDPLAL